MTRDRAPSSGSKAAAIYKPRKLTRPLLAVLLGVMLLTVSSGIGALYVRAAWATLSYLALVLIGYCVVVWLQALSFDRRRGKPFQLLALFGAGLPCAFILYFPLVLLAEVRVPLGMGVLLCAVGLARVAIGFRARRRARWGWIAATGAVTSLTGAAILLAWPSIDLKDIVLIVTLDLMLQASAFVLSETAGATNNHVADLRPLRRRRGGSARSLRKNLAPKILP